MFDTLGCRTAGLLGPRQALNMTWVIEQHKGKALAITNRSASKRACGEHSIAYPKIVKLFCNISGMLTYKSMVLHLYNVNCSKYM